ncbi:alanyl-tRNA editing protein [Planococcus sp. CAU13]|uniref:alanyl-tRNA editing protein n=1 Tax=Planococcus sp. CAU13 TaxID=1541197 RepID=UPI00053004DA|nr:alanyl-tRNA editing protein [Planococcus sp. CAU13]
MTEKIFHQDVSVHTIEAEVIATGTDEKGHYAVLDRSCFYPAGGGQPADTGTIGEAEVLDVQEIEGEIRHYTLQLLENGKVPAAIDWQRRFDHMQQHTGQHLLSAVSENDFGMVTTSFHLGTERVTIDLDIPDITPVQLKAIERRVNELIYRQLPIHTNWVSREEALELPLRKPPAVEGKVRLVEIVGIDLNACGGTHLRNTAELGLIKILQSHKSKSGTRVYFLCGHRAMNHFDLLQTVTDQLTRTLNAPAAELQNAAAAALADRKEKEKQLKKLTVQLIEQEADSLLPEGNLIIKEISGRPFKDVQQLARLAVKKHPSVYVLFTVSEGANIRLVCAKGKNTSGDMKEVLGKMVEKAEGNAGGNEEFAQAGGLLAVDVDSYKTAFERLIKDIT